MPLTKKRKEEIIKDLEEKIDRQKAAVFINFKGLKAGDFVGLRSELKSKDSNITVAKKSLANIAFKNKGIEIDLSNIKDELGIVFGFVDEIIPAKVIHNLSNSKPEIKIIGGIIEKELRTGEDMVALAKLPSREEILVRVVRGIQAPVSGFVNVLQGNIRGLVYALGAIRDNK
ncbi:MAG: 50S ribosomal protein L10 [Candidatus Nealsonbacteria bacterium]|nr:50S ribosomal protein L10 [Candidatus Nealsonbacteria bacterium]